jgi:hypothetical protein
MKSIVYATGILFMLSLLISCAVQTRYIEVKEGDIIYEYGDPKFEVWPGDKLKIITSKVCRGGIGVCYKVKKVDTGEIGYVTAKRMKERHRIYTVIE